MGGITSTRLPAVRSGLPVRPRPPFRGGTSGSPPGARRDAAQGRARSPASGRGFDETGHAAPGIPGEPDDQQIVIVPLRTQTRVERGEVLDDEKPLRGQPNLLEPRHVCFRQPQGPKTSHLKLSGGEAKPSFPSDEKMDSRIPDSETLQRPDETLQAGANRGQGLGGAQPFRGKDGGGA